MLVARIDSTKLISEGMLPGPWMHARMRSFSCKSVSRDGFCEPEFTIREGLYMAKTIGVVMKVVKRAMSTRMVNISSLSTCLATIFSVIKYNRTKTQGETLNT